MDCTICGKLGEDASLSCGLAQVVEMLSLLLLHKSGFSNQLYKKLVKLPSSLGGDAVAVAVGGMSTPATASRVPQECPYCMSAMVPSVDHILWFCSWEPFVKARVLQRPLSDFVARMGWDLTTPRDESFALLTQMGEIRAL